MKKTDRITNYLSINNLTMIMFYMYLSISWFEFYWYSNSYLNEYTRLDLATYTLDKYDSWVSSAKYYDFIIFIFPALLLWNSLFIRLIFYVCFFMLYFVSNIPNLDFTVFGLISQSFYTIVVAFVGFLFCADIVKVSRYARPFLNLVNSKVYLILVYFTALLTVFSSMFGRYSEREQFVHQQLDIYSDSLTLIIGMPLAQAALFMACSLGIFVTGKLRVLLVISSWFALAAFIPMRLEWNAYFMLSDLYTLLSAIALWSTKYSNLNLDNNRNMYVNDGASRVD